MDHQIKKLPKSEVEITITVPEEKMPEYRKRACEELSKDLKIKGFRPGHIPQHVLEQNIDPKYIDAYTQDIAIQRAYADFVIKEKIEVVSRPKVKIEKDSPLTFTAIVAVMPEVTIKDHKSIKVKKEEVKVTEKEIEDVLKDLMKHGTVYLDVDREVKKGDRVEIDFEGFDEEGKSVPNTKSSNHPVIVGENSLIPGFEDEIIGLKKDEKKEFDITFPKDYHSKDFQGKKLHFKVEVKRIEEPNEPELNEDFVEKITGTKKPIEDLKKEIEENIQAKKEQEAKNKHESEYLEALIKKAEIELPEALIDEEVHHMIHEVKDDISMRGIEFEKFLEQAKTTLEDLKKKYRPEAEKRLMIRLSLQHLIKEEDIKVSDEEMTEELAKIKENYPPSEHKKIEEEFTAGNLATQLLNKLALQKLFAKVLGD